LGVLCDCTAALYLDRASSYSPWKTGLMTISPSRSELKSSTIFSSVSPLVPSIECQNVTSTGPSAPSRASASGASSPSPLPPPEQPAIASMMAARLAVPVQSRLVFMMPSLPDVVGRPADGCVDREPLCRSADCDDARG